MGPLFQLIILQMELLLHFTPVGHIKEVISAAFVHGCSRHWLHPCHSCQPHSLLLVISPVSTVPEGAAQWPQRYSVCQDCWTLTVQLLPLTAIHLHHWDKRGRRAGLLDNDLIVSAPVYPGWKYRSSIPTAHGNLVKKNLWKNSGKKAMACYQCLEADTAHLPKGIEKCCTMF